MALDRIRRAIRALVLLETRAFNYHGMYSGTVTAQNPDGSLDVVLDTTLVAGAQRIPTRYGAPGVSAKVTQGARVLVAFVNGDPQKPAVVGWENHHLLELDLGDGALPLARQGDIVQVSAILTPTNSPIAPSGGGPCTGTFSMAGQIMSGTSKVKA